VGQRTAKEFGRPVRKDMSLQKPFSYFNTTLVRTGRLRLYNTSSSEHHTSVVSQGSRCIYSPGLVLLGALVYSCTAIQPALPCDPSGYFSTENANFPKAALIISLCWIYQVFSAISSCGFFIMNPVTSHFPILRGEFVTPFHSTLGYAATTIQATFHPLLLSPFWFFHERHV